MNWMRLSHSLQSRAPPDSIVEQNCLLPATDATHSSARKSSSTDKALDSALSSQTVFLTSTNHDNKNVLKTFCLTVTATVLGIKGGATTNLSPPPRLSKVVLWILKNLRAKIF